jgi:hypothetical protein
MFTTVRGQDHIITTVMAKGLIKLSYRKIIDATSTSLWDKHVFADTHREFYMQAQFFDQQNKYSTFREILENVPKADQMHYLVSTAAVGYIRQLNERIPDVVNASGKLAIPFKNFRFEIIQSHRKNKDQHKVAIYFYSETLTWIDSIDHHLVFAIGDKFDALNKGQEIETDMLLLKPGLSVCSYQKGRCFSAVPNLPFTMN